MAMCIQQEKYSEEYEIKRGPNNFGLSVGFTYPGDWGPNLVTFYTAGKPQRRFDVFLTKMISPDARIDAFARNQWEFEGIVFGKRPMSKVKGTFNSRARTGKLYVLDHEQPKPLVEALSWDEMTERLQNKEIYGLSVFEARGRATNSFLKRDYLTNVRRITEKGYLIIECSKTNLTFWTLRDGSVPLVLADGRILFSADGFDCVVYPRGSYA